MPAAVMEEPQVKLTGHDRCDSCNAQAFIVAELEARQLIFCGHHGNMHKAKLVETGWTIWDFTHLINEAASVPTY